MQFAGPCSQLRLRKVAEPSLTNRDELRESKATGLGRVSGGEQPRTKAEREVNKERRQCLHLIWHVKATSVSRLEEAWVSPESGGRRPSGSRRTTRLPQSQREKREGNAVAPQTDF